MLHVLGAYLAVAGGAAASAVAAGTLAMYSEDPFPGRSYLFFRFSAARLAVSLRLFS
jgi:hypothetical protein